MKISQLSFFFLVLTSACSLRIEPEYKTYIKSEFTWEESQWAVATRKFYNDNKDKSTNQDRGLGMLMILKEVSSQAGLFRLGQCTAFLLDESTLVTNAHCVPKKIREGATCRNRIYFAYDAGTSKNYSCEKVLFVHPDYKTEDEVEAVNMFHITPDIAILSIEPVTGVRYYAKSDSPLKKESSLLVQSVDPADLSGSLVFEGRYSTDKSFKIADHALDGSPFRWIEALTSLFVVHGNSGSPVLDSVTLKVMGVAFAAKKNRGLVLDLSCLVHESGEWKWKEACPSVSSIRF